MPEMTATIPHQLGKAEAKRRIQSQVGSLRHQYGSLFSNLSENWTGDTMAFSLTSMGQTVSGRLEVTDEAVNVAVTLPWVFQVLAQVIQPRIEESVRKALEPK
jgi:Putative polyhydroxyalkanoic acid system protein (PHA_gran_rgn)